MHKLSIKTVVSLQTLTAIQLGRSFVNLPMLNNCLAKVGVVIEKRGWMSVTNNKIDGKADEGNKLEKIIC